ncbi:hypothetical protein [Flavobacterium sp.]|uniref:hypothetical protein n=1 Tax=Flavobacterium sp. TaxID=239 RepID=UPI002B4B8D69|nr:hypothetical protein [Flavobacterium sp.]HLF52319.1 hypothetical protein [Flavobacterium sp.]
MKKILFAFGCVIAFGSAIKAQESKGGIVVYIPKTNTCFEASSTSISKEGSTLSLTIKDAIQVEPTKDRIMSASACNKGAVIDVKDEGGGNHTINCDSSVATTCFCTGAK